MLVVFQDYQNQPISVEWDLKIKGKGISGDLFYSFDNADDQGEIEVFGQKIK